MEPGQASDDSGCSSRIRSKRALQRIARGNVRSEGNLFVMLSYATRRVQVQAGAALLFPLLAGGDSRRHCHISESLVPLHTSSSILHPFLHHSCNRVPFSCSGGKTKVEDLFLGTRFSLSQRDFSMHLVSSKIVLRKPDIKLIKSVLNSVCPLPGFP